MTTIFSAIFMIAIAISATLVVILINNYYLQKRMDELFFAFNEAATEFNLSLSKMELLGNRIIGLDDEKNKLLFLAKTKKKCDGYLIDLSEIKTVTVKNEYQKSGAAYIKRIGVKTLVDKVVLQLDYNDKDRSLRLPFYEKAIDHLYEVRKRSELAKDWQLLLSNGFRRNRQPVESDQDLLQAKDIHHLYRKRIGA